MWLIITFLATISASMAYFLMKEYRKKFRLGLLSLMLLGTFIMTLVDHIIAFIGGEPFIEITTDGLITSGTVLGIVMIIPIILIWLASIVKQSAVKSDS